MPFIYYKFKCSTVENTITFDDLFISIRDVKEAIKQQNRIGENSDLQLINEKTNESYKDDTALLSDETILLATRIPSQSTSRAKDRNMQNRGNSNMVVKVDINAPKLAHITDLSNYEATEEEKLEAIIYQSTIMYRSINYNNQAGPPPPGYRCHICNKEGHWIKDCQNKKSEKFKKSTGIPRSHLVEVDGPQVQGALMTENGSYALPLLDHQIYIAKQKKILNKTNSAISKPQLPDILINKSNQEEVDDDSSKQILTKIPVLPSSIISKNVTNLGIVNVKPQDCNEKPISIGSSIITIPKLVTGNKGTLPLPVSVPALPNAFYPSASFAPIPSFIDYSKPPPPLPSNFRSSLKEKQRATIDDDNMEDFLNNLRKRDEEDKKKQMVQKYKYRHCSRSRSRDPSNTPYTRSHLMSSTDSNRSRNTRRRSKERRHEADDLDQRSYNSSRKPIMSHSRDRSNEHKHRDHKFGSRKTALEKTKRDGRWRDSSSHRDDFYDTRKRRK